MGYWEDYAVTLGGFGRIAKIVYSEMAFQKFINEIKDNKAPLFYPIKYCNFIGLESLLIGPNIDSQTTATYYY